MKTIRRTKKERARSRSDPVVERKGQSGGGGQRGTLPACAPVEFSPKVETESVTRTERRRGGREGKRGGRKTHRRTDKH